ncbi:hypothetical protein HAX54_012445 [Datura stramonium]|uniref:Uncharacterized protein n=1 Tax=Datura stramonium TaxID=4076 RepID=A0ABS8TJR9_DATST|nr:hypothetical protein [Datura stramonium]
MIQSKNEGAEVEQLQNHLNAMMEAADSKISESRSFDGKGCCWLLASVYHLMRIEDGVDQPEEIMTATPDYRILNKRRPNRRKKLSNV